MNPSIPDHFSWQAVYDDPEGFVRSLGTENQSSTASEQGQTYHPDSFHQYARQTQPGACNPNFDDGSSDFSQASVPPHYYQAVDSLDPFGPSPSAYPVAPNEIAAFLDEPFPSNQCGHYGETASVEDPSASHHYNPYDPTSAVGDHSASHHYNPYDPTSAVGDYSASHSYNPYDPTSAVGDYSASHSYNPYDSPAAVYAPYPSHPFGQNVAPFYPSENEAQPLHPQSTEISRTAGSAPYGVHIPSRSPSPSRAVEPSDNVRSSHSQNFDPQRLQALQASFAMALPGVRAGKFDDSILSQSFQAFGGSNITTVLRIADLGKIDHVIDNTSLLQIFVNHKASDVADSIDYFNEIMSRNNIGRIESATPQKGYILKKGENFHLVDVLCEAYFKVSQDLDIHVLPLRFAEVLALFYGTTHLARGAIATKLGVSPSAISHIVTDCNSLLKREKSPLSIVTRFKRYCLAFNEPELVS